MYLSTELYEYWIGNKEIDFYDLQKFDSPGRSSCHFVTFPDSYVTFIDIFD